MSVGSYVLANTFYVNTHANMHTNCKQAVIFLHLILVKYVTIIIMHGTGSYYQWCMLSHALYAADTSLARLWLKRTSKFGLDKSHWQWLFDTAFNHKAIGVNLPEAPPFLASSHAVKQLIKGNLLDTSLQKY